jgi:hypothetical protein
MRKGTRMGEATSKVKCDEPWQESTSSRICRSIRLAVVHVVVEDGFNAISQTGTKQQEMGIEYARLYVQSIIVHTI